MATLDVRANTPPTAAALLIRSSIIGGWDRLEDLWREWENWFVDVAETHTSLPALVFFRSPHWEHSWVTASGGGPGRGVAAGLDGGPAAQRRRRALHPCRLRRSAADRRLPQHAAQPRPALAGGPDPDRPARLAGWRVNYDRVLLSLAALTKAPQAPWPSDRSMIERNGSRIRRHNRPRA